MVYEVWRQSRFGRTPMPLPRPVGPAVAVTAGIVLAALTVLTWWLWLGQDTTYQRNAQGQWSGPYEAPQVIACALTLTVLAGLATVLLSAPVVIGVTALSFTAAWSIYAAARDSTGLWPIGAFAVFFGTLIGMTVAVGLAVLIRWAWAAHRQR